MQQRGEIKHCAVMSTSTPIPTALVVPIIEAFAEGVSPAFSFILILTIGGTLLVPLLISLLALSSPALRRRPVFILNVLSLSFGILCSALGTHIAIRGVLSPFTNVSLGEDIFYSTLDIWKGWGAEAVLLIRIAAVFPRSQWPIVLALPVTLKTTRVGLNIVFNVKWIQLVLSGTRSGYVILQNLPRYLFKTVLTLELVDNSYVSFLFLWRLHQHRRRSFLESGIGEPSRQPFKKKVQRLFWIASTNFVFPLILNVALLITVFDGSSAAVYASIYQVNAYVVIICTVLATVWSTTSSFTEAVAHQESTISLQPVIFRVRQTYDTASVAQPGGELKSVNWEESK
ncbi:hypothetical protein MVEN_00175600 [Mycena venus]|uniref:Uncharacterized protein n=1 Tax=Mycena venus TaxID=2733690 RepID=A0A8H6YWR8_9AGAR|nr:hypothetical protein MVEN_00175600 [Mycena venus]